MARKVDPTQHQDPLPPEAEESLDVLPWLHQEDPIPNNQVLILNHGTEELATRQGFTADDIRVTAFNNTYVLVTWVSMDVPDYEDIFAAIYLCDVSQSPPVLLDKLVVDPPSKEDARGQERQFDGFVIDENHIILPSTFWSGTGLQMIYRDGETIHQTDRLWLWSPDTEYGDPYAFHLPLVKVGPNRGMIAIHANRHPEIREQTDDNIANGQFNFSVATFEWDLDSHTIQLGEQTGPLSPWVYPRDEGHGYNALPFGWIYVKEDVAAVVSSRLHSDGLGEGDDQDRWIYSYVFESQGLGSAPVQLWEGHLGKAPPEHEYEEGIQGGRWRIPRYAGRSHAFRFIDRGDNNAVIFFHDPIATETDSVTHYNDETYSLVRIHADPDTYEVTMSEMTRFWAESGYHANPGGMVQPVDGEIVGNRLYALVPLEVRYDIQVDSEIYFIDDIVFVTINLPTDFSQEPTVDRTQTNRIIRSTRETPSGGSFRYTNNNFKLGIASIGGSFAISWGDWEHDEPFGDWDWTSLYLARYTPPDDDVAPVRIRQRTDELLGHGPRVENAGNSPSTRQRSSRFSQSYW